jgi:hypothetical protein
MSELTRLQTTQALALDEVELLRQEVEAHLDWRGFDSLRIGGLKSANATRDTFASGLTEHQLAGLLLGGGAGGGGALRRGRHR